ncbi:MAG: HAD-IC family P-type ATPase [Gammaproteobacteria bacterium]|nr:HAD-IC family P-type ATPase [Gammaproteobacteria bacterium]
MTGESAPRVRTVGDPVFAGTLNVSQPVSLTATTAIADTRMATIHRLAQRASLDKPPVAVLADAVAHYFVTGVIGIAAATYIIWQFVDPTHALWATIAVLVVSCPCALSLATPAAITAGATALRRIGFLATRARVIEDLARVTHIVFDKTGTLTGGKPELVASTPLAEVPVVACEGIAAALEGRTNHPLSEAFPATSMARAANDVRIHTGQGVSGQVGDTRYRLGSAQFCRINRSPRDSRYTTIYLCREDAPDGAARSLGSQSSVFVCACATMPWQRSKRFGASA